MIEELFNGNARQIFQIKFPLERLRYPVKDTENQEMNTFFQDHVDWNMNLNQYDQHLIAADTTMIVTAIVRTIVADTNKTMTMTTLKQLQAGTVPLVQLPHYFSSLLPVTS